MRRMIFVSILLTLCTFVRAQDDRIEKPVRVIFTTHYQNHPFGYDPVWRYWPDGSLPRALTYINAHRKAMGIDRIALLNSGSFTDTYRLFPSNDLVQRISEYVGFQDYAKSLKFELEDTVFGINSIFDGGFSSFWDRADIVIGFFDLLEVSREDIAKIPGLDMAVIASGRDPEVYKVINIEGDTVTVVNTGTTGKYIGVADFYSPNDFSVKTVDISGFPVDAEYEAYFKPLSDSIQAYFSEPLVTLKKTVRQSESLFGPSEYSSLFHRFQLETTRADISFFACPEWGDSIPQGDVSFRDIVRRFRYDNGLRVIELTGAEIKQYLEYTYGLRYNTMRNSTDDLLRMTRDRDGVLRPRTAVYNLDDAAGIRYEVDASRPQGRRIRVISMDNDTPFDLNGRYRVAVNSHRLNSGYLGKACGLSGEQVFERLQSGNSGNLRLMLREWLLNQKEITPKNVGNWNVVPESFVRTAKQRMEFLHD